MAVLTVCSRCLHLKVWYFVTHMTPEKLHALLFPVGLALIALVVLVIIRSILFKMLSKVVGTTKSHVDDLILNLIRTPSLFWCFVTSLYIGVAFANLPDKQERQIYQIIHVLLILSFTLAGSNIAATFFKNLLKTNNPDSETSALSVGMVKAAVLSTGLLLILSTLGVSIAPLLTALGVGGLAVALALKDTLENLFAGIYLLTDKTIRVGDFVRLDSGQEGFVSDIGWRTSKFRTTSNNTIIIPNSKLASTMVTNHSYPDKRVVTTIPLQIDGSTNLPQLETSLLNVLKKGSEDIVGLLASPEPNVRLAQINSDGSLTYHLNFSIKDYSDNGFVSHEVRKRIYKQLKADYVSFPQQSIKLLPN